MTLLMGTKTGKEQFKMYLPEETVQELEALATKHGKRSGQEIVTELIEFYLPVWRAVDTHTKQAVKRHAGAVGNEELEAKTSNRRQVPYEGEITDGKQQQKKRGAK
jgi:hypothetical protein